MNISTKLQKATKHEIYFYDMISKLDKQPIQKSKKESKEDGLFYLLMAIWFTILFGGITVSLIIAAHYISTFTPHLG